MEVQYLVAHWGDGRVAHWTELCCLADRYVDTLIVIQISPV